MKVTIIICSIILVLFLVLMITNNMIQEAYNYHLSDSIQIAKKEKTFVKVIKPKSSQFVIDGINIQFDDCWIEKASRMKYILMLIPTVAVRKPESYYICFTLKNPHNDRISQKFCFKREDSEYGFAVSSGENGDVFYDEIKSISIKELKVNVLNESRTGKKLGEISFMF